MTRLRLWTMGAWLAPALFAFVVGGPWSVARCEGREFLPLQRTTDHGPRTMEAVLTPPVHSAALFAEWEWSEFVRYWRTQFGKTTGVMGIVTLVALVGFLIIMTKGRTPGKG